LVLVWGHQAFATGDLSVDVKASQWDWKFSVKKLPVDQPVIFNITSSDVSHGFTIYDDAGAVLVQTTVVPGETAHVKHVFTKAGKYPVRCMLYCGMGHDGMKNELTVVEGR
jgi:cytochrome c oxidase subunit 2